MKKYNLVIKESVRYIEKGDFPTLTTGNKGAEYFQMLSKKGEPVVGRPFSLTINIEDNRNNKMTMFTQQEIDELPHGFVKLFDIIEVKEELYYIKMPHGGGVVLNEVWQDDKVRFSDREETTHCKTKFTLGYIEETYPEYKQFAVKVEEEK